MGSVGNTNPWEPYNTYKDCSQGICSIYCPQYCYLIFPPPPSRTGGTHFSPLIIAIISVLASALILVIYYTLVTRFCKGRRHNTGISTEEDHDEISNPQEPCHVVSIGLDEKTIKAIAVQRYKNGGMTVDGSKCVVCLSEFQENEPLRVLPKCNHAFHLPCIDTWLASHSICPLCRANVVVSTPQPSQVASQSSNVIIEMDNQEMRHNEQVDASFASNSNTSRENPLNSRNRAMRNDHREFEQLTRSNSLGSLPCSCRIFNLNTSKIEEPDTKKDRNPGNILGSSKQLGVKRCFSTGRLMFTDCNTGKKSILPY